MRESWRTRLDRLAQAGQRLNRRVEKTVVKYIQWQDRRHAHRRQKFLRQGWLYSTLLGLWLVLIVLECWAINRPRSSIARPASA